MDNGQPGAICYTRTIEDISQEDIAKRFGDVMKKYYMVKEFMARETKGARIICADELELHEVALFQINHEGIMDTVHLYYLSDIMAEFEVDRNTGTVKAKKLYRLMGKYKLETRIYYIGNYGKTWRAWTAVPAEEEAKGAEWDEH